MKRTLVVVALTLIASTLIVTGGATPSGASGPDSYLATGAYHTCAVTGAGDARCWGANYNGQAPPGVTGPFSAIAAGAYHACALTPAGEARCWGYNSSGQAPAQVSGPFTAIAAGAYHACALTPAGDARCWGYNALGEAPPQLTGPYTSLTAGAYHTCALTPGGDARCWGANHNGQAPPGVTGPFNAITAGDFDTCAITATGDARCWGYNSYGQAPPAGVVGPFTAIAAGAHHTCALTPAGDARCWGYNSYGQAPPAGVVGPFTAVSAGAYHTCALTEAADLRCWGSNDNAQAPSLVSGPFGSAAGVNIDTTAPTITASTSPSPNSNGWYNGSVTIHFNCSDALSGVKSCPSDITMTGDGANRTVSGTTTDNAGNAASTTVSGINIDTAAPTVAYGGNAGTYTVDQTVSIRCIAEDGLSGIDSTTCADTSGPAYSFGVGTHTLTASARDKAGNDVALSTTFTVVDTPESLSNLVNQLVTDSGTAGSLTAKIAAIAASTNANAKHGQVNAFINQTNAQTGKSITATDAALLLVLIKLL